MPSYQKYLPGRYDMISRAVGSVASNSHSTSVLCRANHKGSLLAAYLSLETAKATEGTTPRAYYIRNGGALGTGTTILASYAGVAATLAAFVPISLTTQANCTWSGGDVLKFETASGAVGSDNKVMNAGSIQLDYRFDR